MKIKSWIVSSLAVCAVTAFVLPVVAHSGGDKRFGHKGFARIIERNAERLDIDDVTLERIEAIAEQSRENARDLREKMKREHGVLRDLLSQDKPDESVIMSQADLMGELRTSIQKERLKTWLEVRALLTPEQRQELSEIRGEYRERFKRKRSRRHGSDGPAVDPPTEG